jgi:hypothetical protein
MCKPSPFLCWLILNETGSPQQGFPKRSAVISYICFCANIKLYVTKRARNEVCRLSALFLKSGLGELKSTRIPNQKSKLEVIYK